DLVRLAKRHGAKVLTSTYNEPLITSEWAVEIFKEAKKAGLVCSYVSNGNGTERVLDYIAPYVDLYKVDLKGFSDAHYRDLGGTLQPVLDTIRSLKQRGIWVEIVTLVIPGFNDSDEELPKIAEFPAGAFADLEGTHCPQCNALVIGRTGFRVTSYRLQNGKCSDCGTAVPGVWGEGRAAVGRSGVPRPVSL